MKNTPVLASAVPKSATDLAWLTDLHLNFCPGRVQELLDRVDATEPDVVLIGGDIGEAPDVIGYFEQFATLDRPVYFVLGNHDFYRGSIRQVRAAAEGLCRRVENLNYLPSAGVVELTSGAALVGHDGWGATHGLVTSTTRPWR